MLAKDDSMNKTLVTITASVATLAIATAAVAGGGPGGRLLFPGGDEAIQQAAAELSGEPLEGSFQSHGLEFNLLSIMSDTTQTVVSLRIDGKQDAGNMASPAGRPALIDDQGARYLALAILPDQDDPRAQTWLFPPVPAGASELVLSFDGVQLWHRPAEPGPTTQEPPNVLTLTDIEVRMAVSWTGQLAPSEKHDLGAASFSAFGKGRLVVDSFEVSTSGTVISGHLEGFSPDEIAEINMFPATLNLPDGSVAAAVWGRSGFGEGRESFEFRFLRLSPTGATLHVPFKVSPNAHDETVASALRAFASVAASVTILD
jgi:hypothetical protein